MPRIFTSADGFRVGSWISAAPADQWPDMRRPGVGRLKVRGRCRPGGPRIERSDVQRLEPDALEGEVELLGRDLVALAVRERLLVHGHHFIADRLELAVPG